MEVNYFRLQHQQKEAYLIGKAGKKIFYRNVQWTQGGHCITLRPSRLGAIAVNFYTLPMKSKPVKYSTLHIITNQPTVTKTTFLSWNRDL